MRVVVIAGFVLAALSGCTGSGFPGAVPSYSLPPAPTGSAPGEPLLISATGYGPYQVGQSQAELVEAKTVVGLQADEAGCVSGTGLTALQSPQLRFADGKLVQIEVYTLAVGTAEGLMVGMPVGEAQSRYPDGKTIFGRPGAAWEVPDGTNALLVKITGDDVTSLVGGVTSSVEDRHRDGVGC